MGCFDRTLDAFGTTTARSAATERTVSLLHLEEMSKLNAQHHVESSSVQLTALTDMILYRLIQDLMST